MKWYPWLRPAYEKLVESYQAGTWAPCATDSGLTWHGRRGAVLCAEPLFVMPAA
ncbi:DNA polymerase III subunit delta' [Salmonella enterica subsp. enterica serovar Daytona]|uniref:DNA polymerase III subunit delta n=1 Tax=Salmonella enterica subsp. enterica serovar Daytona TaxID=1962639 RepID=A0A447JJG7_SALET|nr:DNA polymerase III subunit delta' [Salmonella enterica subsp. enterica serovar Daytona]